MLFGTSQDFITRWVTLNVPTSRHQFLLFHRRLYVKICLRSHLQSDKVAFFHWLCLNIFTPQTQEQVHIKTCWLELFVWHFTQFFTSLFLIVIIHLFQWCNFSFSLHVVFSCIFSRVSMLYFPKNIFLNETREPNFNIEHVFIFLPFLSSWHFFHGRIVHSWKFSFAVTWTKLQYSSQTCSRREDGRCWAQMAAIRGSHSLGLFFSMRSRLGLGLGLGHGLLGMYVPFTFSDAWCRHIKWDKMQTILNKSAQFHVRIRSSVFIVTSISESTAARVPQELSPDHGRASQVVPHVRDKVSLPCSGRALADLPMSTQLASSLTLVLDERVGEEDPNCSDARFWSSWPMCMVSLCKRSGVKSRWGVAEGSSRSHLLTERRVTSSVSSGTSAYRIALLDRLPPQSCQRDWERGAPGAPEESPWFPRLMASPTEWSWAFSEVPTLHLRFSFLWGLQQPKTLGRMAAGAGDFGSESEHSTSRVSLLREWMGWVLLVLKISGNAIM